MDGIYSQSLCATRNGRRERGRAADVAGQVRGLEVGEIERPGRTIGQHSIVGAPASPDRDWLRGCIDDLGRRDA
jgi:hypothetical protein